MFAAVNIKILVIALANFARAVEHGKTVPVIVASVIALTVVAMVVAVYSFGRAVQAWERQATSLRVPSDEEIESWEDFWEAQEERYIASLTGADYLDATGVHDDLAEAEAYQDQRAREIESGLS